jgi:periplasmic divalent cation tolerance protein
MEFRSVYVTAKGLAEARLIGGTLVREKLVACANYFPIQSIYWWQGKVEEAGEFAIIAKTTSALVERVVQRVKELHSYDVPCVVSWIIEKGNPGYLEWIKDSTSGEESK